MAHRHQELLRLYRQVRVQLRPPDLVKAQGAQFRVRRPPLDSQLQRQTVVVQDLDRLFPAKLVPCRRCALKSLIFVKNEPVCRRSVVRI